MSEAKVKNRCKDCKHVESGDREGDLTCGHPKFVFGYGEELVSPDGLVIEHDEGWGWIVGPEFGCVHFEQKLEETEECLSKRS